MQKAVLTTLKILSAMVMILLIFYALYGQVNQLINPYPGEYRDGASAYMVKQIYQGINPYLMKNVTYSNAYVYGPIMPCVAAAIMKITGWPALICLKTVSFLCLLALVGLMGICIYQYSENWLLAILGGGYFLGLCQVTTTPDNMGMFMWVACIMILDKVMNLTGKRDRFYGVLAVLTVVLFYIKVTFVLIAIPIFLTLWFKDRKGAIVYALSGTVVGGGSLMILYLTMPLTLINMLYIQMVEKSGILSMGGVMLAGRRYLTFVKGYFAFFIMLIVALIFNIVYIKKKREKRIELPLILTITIITLLVICFYMGMSQGGSYHNQLVGPSLIIAGCICGAKLIKNCESKTIWCLVFIGIVGSAWNSAAGVVRPNTKEENANWAKAYEMLDNYTKNGQEIYLSSEFACYALDHDLTIYDNGHGYYLMMGTHSYIPGLYDVGERYKWLVPVLGELNDRTAELAADLRTKIQNKEFGAVIGGFNEDMFMNDVRDNYICVGSMNLRMGEEISDSKIYIPR